MGMSMASQNMKKRMRSSEANTPIMPVSSASKKRKNSHSLSDSNPRGENREGGEKCRQENEEDAQTIYTQVIAHLGHLDPRPNFLKLHPRVVRIEFQEKRAGENESNEGGDERCPLHRFGGIAPEEGESDRSH